MFKEVSNSFVNTRKKKKIMKVEEPLNVAVSLNSYKMLMKHCLNPKN